MIARGASPNAAPELRPAVESSLNRLIARADELPLDLPATSSVTLAQISGAPERTGNSSGGVASVPVETSPTYVAPAPEPVAPPSGAAPRSGSKRGLVIGAAALVLLAIAGIAVWLMRSKEDNISAGSSVYWRTRRACAGVYSDVHGRMVLVAEGAFQFNAASEDPAQTVSLTAFYVDETEVSNAEPAPVSVEATGHASKYAGLRASRLIR